MQPNFVKHTTKLLTQEEELALFKEWRDARDQGLSGTENRLFNRIIVQYSPIVNKLVGKMKGYKLDRNELMSEALLGLTKAIVDFDPEKGFRFGTYASNCVLGTLYTYVTKNYFMTNICNNSKNKKIFFALRRLINDKSKKDSHFVLTDVVLQEFADNMDVSFEAVKEMNHILNNPYSSLNESINSEDGTTTTFQDQLESNDPSQYETLEAQQLNTLRMQLVNEALDTLDDRSKVIVTSLSLAEEEDKSTLEILGKQFSISRERVRQLRIKAEEKIKRDVQSKLATRSIRPADILPVE